MFDCGIYATMQEISNQIIKKQEDFIVNSVQEFYADIDREKLEKCLSESKSFYDDGYKDGEKDVILMVINSLNNFTNFSDEDLKKILGLNDDQWILEDYWAGFGDAIAGLKRYFEKKYGVLGG